TLRVDATSAVEGWAVAGAIVDVLLVTKEGATVVAEQVKILSAERSVVSPDEGQPRVPSTVTVLVSQEQCLALNAAVNLGKIAFALRSSQDEGTWKSPQYEAARLKSLKEAQVFEGARGYIRVKQPDNEIESYTLTGGRWVKSDVRPEGFFEAEGE